MNNSILRKTLTSSTATFGILAGIGSVTSPAQAAVITNGCAATDSCTLTELFNGSSIQIGQKLLTDWSLVTTNVTGTATNFNFDNILVTESLFNIEFWDYLQGLPATEN